MRPEIGRVVELASEFTGAQTPLQSAQHVARTSVEGPIRSAGVPFQLVPAEIGVVEELGRRFVDGEVIPFGIRMVVDRGPVAVVDGRVVVVVVKWGVEITNASMHEVELGRFVDLINQAAPVSVPWILPS